MRQLDVENKLRDVVSRIIVQVELATAQGRTDINLALEDAFIPILRSVYNLPQLVNLNRKQKNFPGIDLGDDHDRVCFQVTSTTSLDKVKATLRQFIDRSYFNSFDELYVLTLVKKQSSYSQAAVNEIVGDRFVFNTKKHVIDLGDLLGLVAALRLPAQERILEEFQRILGEVDAYIAYSSDSIPDPTAITTNLQRISMPHAVYVAELTIDDKEVVALARKTLSYKGKARSRTSVVKMALLLNGVHTDAWVCHDNKLFAFHDMEASGLISIVDEGSVERLDVSDLADSSEIDNVNVLKQLLTAEARDLLKPRHVRMQPKDRFFYFVADEEGQSERKEFWIGKQRAIRRVYFARPSKKDPSKVAHHQHLSFELTFARLGEEWYAQIVPGWFYSYDGFRESNWHDDLLSQQKRLERNSSVRNQVRFIAYFLAAASGQDGLAFQLRRTELRIGIVGRGEGVDLLDEWLVQCRSGIERKKESKLLNLFRGFGGINQSYGFLTRLINSPQYTRTLQKSEIGAVVKLPSRADRVDRAVELYYEQIRFLAENRSVDVIVCVMPNEMFDSVTSSKEGEDGESELEHNFRRILKAKCMHLGTPLQLVREKTILITKQTGEQQDPATKAWNFCTALYYKGNRTIPWRLVEDTAKLRSCYIGIGFYKSRDGETVSSSLAQVFDEFGHGIILRGTPVSIDKKNRHPYLNEDQAYELLRDALDEYDRALQHMPARIVIHKSSHFRDSERRGFLRALDEKGIRTKDFVAITDTDIRLFGDGDYPPKRGTMLAITETEGLLYTRGTVDFYKTYPGAYVPKPLKVTVYEQDSSLESLCEEILGLTKMNWNNTQMDGRLPITLECARKIGDIMKYVSPTEKPQVSYSFYM